MLNKILKIFIELFVIGFVVIAATKYYVSNVIIKPEVNKILVEANRTSNGIVSESDMKQIITINSAYIVMTKTLAWMIVLVFLMYIFINFYMMSNERKHKKKKMATMEYIFVFVGLLFIYIFFESMVKKESFEIGSNEQMAEAVIQVSGSEVLYLQYKNYAAKNKLFRSEDGEKKYKKNARDFQKMIPKSYMIDFYEAQKL